MTILILKSKKRERWPAGSPNGQGGRFKPKNSGGGGAGRVSFSPDDTPMAKAKKVIYALEKIPGVRVNIVGGIVRDRLMGKKSKDIDTEVFGLTQEQLSRELDKIADQTNSTTGTVGESFGVTKFRFGKSEHDEIDFALPRTEQKTGEGHKGFEVVIDPFMTDEEAASRRDFTVNSMALNSKGQLIDPFGGKSDLERGILRHVSDKAFSDDPLRVLRGFSQSGRFNLKAHPETVRLAKEVKHTFDELPKERVFGELSKWAKKSQKPSAGLRFLEESEWIENFPALNALRKTPQNPKYHPEGDVWEHTLHVSDEAARIAKEKRYSEDRTEAVVISALLHDIAKPQTTFRVDSQGNRVEPSRTSADDGHEWVSPKHPQEGGEVARKMLKDMKAPNDLIEKVVFLTEAHMWHNSLQEVTTPAVKRMMIKLDEKGLSMDDLATLVEADHSGRPPLPRRLPAKMKEALRVASEIGEIKKATKPLVGGKELIGLGVKPGPKMGAILREISEAQIDGEFDTTKGGIEWARRRGLL